MITKLQRCRTITISLNHLRPHQLFPHHQHRYFCFHEGPDTVEELLDRHVAKKDNKKSNTLDDDENSFLTRQRLTTTRREVLSLYRDIIRATRYFVWPDSKGVLWRDILRANARKEFDEARFETDPEIITRLLIGGHDAVEAALDKLVEKQKQQIEKERSDSNPNRR